MKRGALLLTLVVASFGAACSGGGGGGTTPPPPPLGFSNSSLKGQYAFTMTGQTFQDPNGPFVARIGTFIADGNGNITGGVELVNTASGGLQSFNFQNSGYQVSSDGRGGLNLTNLTGTLSFSITLVSTTQGYISQSDGITSTSGTFELQDSSAFTTNGINGSYVFDNSGLDPSGNPDSIIGQFTLNSGTVSGVFDENDSAVPTGPQSVTNGTYSFSDTTNGIGTIFFGPFQYDFVVVSNKKMHMIEVPGQGSSLPVTVGTANAQTAPPTTDAGLTGSF